MATEDPPNNHPGCSDCASGNCPYWYQDSDGIWHHDTSGAQGYIDNTIVNDTYGINSKLPNTPKRDWW
jgi:hypothetical protein